jgi:hypothetical protein
LVYDPWYGQSYGNACEGELIVSFPQIDESKPIDYTVIGEPLNKLLIATANKLSREWPSKYRNVTGARELFVMHLRIARLTYRSVLFIGGDTPVDPRRLPEFCVSLPVLNRAILDSLFTVLFILEDVPYRCAWFREADYRESRLELDRYTAEYGNLPEWKTHLEEFSKACEMGLALTNLSPAQTANPRGLRSWPNAGAMVNYQVSPGTPLSPMRSFMKYLNDYFYIDLSQQAHLGGWGMTKRAGFLIDEIRDLPGTDAQVKKYRYYQIAQAVALVLALVSEIELHFNFGLRQDALYVWNLAAPVIAVANEVYQKRYSGLL